MHFEVLHDLQVKKKLTYCSPEETCILKFTVTYIVIIIQKNLENERK